MAKIPKCLAFLVKVRFCLSQIVGIIVLCASLVFGLLLEIPGKEDKYKLPGSSCSVLTISNQHHYVTSGYFYNYYVPYITHCLVSNGAE